MVGYKVRSIQIICFSGEDVEGKVDFKDVRANRTSQLRAIYWSDKNSTKPPLWKMPRFTKSEKHIDSNNSTKITKKDNNLAANGEINLELRC